MHKQETLKHLRWHAGLEEDPSRSGPSVAACSWLQNNKVSLIDEAIDDALRAFERLNFEINGPVPSANNSPDTQISRQLIYAVNEQVRMLQESAEKSKIPKDTAAFRAGARKIMMAWNAVVAGDIDNILEHITSEISHR